MAYSYLASKSKLLLVQLTDQQQGPTFFRGMPRNYLIMVTIFSLFLPLDTEVFLLI